MALPTFGAAGTYFNNVGGDGASAAIDVPNGVVANSVVVVFLHREFQTSTVSAPDGTWTQLGTPVVNGSMEYQAWWHRATGTESTAGTYTFTWSGNAFRTAVAITVDNCATSGSPIEIFGTTTVSGTTSLSIAGGSTTAADRLVVYSPTCFNGTTYSGYANSTSALTWTERVDAGNLAVATAPKATSGALGNITATSAASDDHATIKFALIGLTAQSVTLTGIASGEAFGSASITSGPVSVTATGIGSAEAIGTPSVVLTVNPTGIASLEAFGDPTILQSGAVAPTGIPSAEAFGSATITAGPIDVTAASIGSAEAFGTPSVVLTISPLGIASLEAFGTPALTVGAVGVTPAGIASAEVFGALTLAAGPISVTVASIGSGEAFGAPALSFSLYPTGIPSAGAFGAPVLTVGAISIFLTGIASGEAFGTPSLSVTLDVRLRISKTRERILPRYELLVVARIPQQTAAPAFLTVNPIDWSALDWSSTVSRAQTLSAKTKISSITEEVKQRLRDPRGLPTELWLQRNGKTVFAGPLTGGSTGSGELTLVAGGLLTYLDWMIVTADTRFDQVDQFTIAKQLVDQWQSQDFGNFGIDTSGVGASGRLRDGTYARNEIHYVGKRIQELGARLDGFDVEIDPATRRLQLWYPTKGVNRSAGENAVVFDSRNVDAQDGLFSLGPGILASEAFGVGASSGSSAALWSQQSNTDLRAAFGRTAVTGSWSDVSEQTTLDDHVAALRDARDQPLRAPGRRVRVTTDSDLDSYAEGDTVQYELDKLLGIGGAYRIRSRKVTVQSGGQESVDLEFV